MSTGFNQRNAFSHSGQCDALLSIPDPAPGGIEHTRCLCWCHGLDNEPTYNVIDPGYDLSPPPEYANSADAAFINTEPAALIHRAEIEVTPVEFDSDPYFPESPEIATIGERDYSLSALSTQYPNRSRQELVRGVCDNCGDALVKCECVE